MVFKKPYAFLIKNFKLIHFILSALMIFVAFKTSIVLNLYKDYINNLTSITNSSSYINIFIYLVIIIIILISFVTYWLMKYKKKPKLLYVLIIILNILIIISFSFASSNMTLLEENINDAQTVRLVRDILRISFWLQCISIVPMIIRTLGFDIKKFEFAKDLQELNIDITDNEEIELVMGVDTNKIKRKGRRSIRELKYYYHENKIFLHIILGIIIIGVGFYLFFNVKIVNKIYSEKEVFSSYKFNLEVHNSFVTNKSYDGTDIGYNSTSYVIVKININSNYDNIALNSNDFILVIDKQTYLPTKKYYNYFSDLGIGYTNQSFTKDITKTYILVYNISNKYLNKKMSLRYELGYDDKGKTNRMVNLNPINFDKKVSLGNFKLNMQVDFKDSILNNSTLIIKEENIKDNDIYNEEVCEDNDCYNKEINIKASKNKKLLILTIESNYDKTYIDLSNYSLIEYYGKLKYITNKEYTSSIVDKTPLGEVNKLYLEVDSNIENASKIWIDFDVRGKKYKYILKENL